MPKFLSKAIALCVAISALVFVGVSAVHAAPGDSITLYLSAPLVQGSNVTGTGSLSDDFNSYATGNCPSSTNIGTLVASVASACYISNTQTYGGASSTSSSPAFGGSGSKFPATPFPGTGTITFNFPAAVKYVGFWWSAGNSGNTVEFLNSGSVIATYTSSTLMTQLGAAPWSGAYPSSRGNLTSIGGDSYPKGWYFGNPRGFTSTTPVSQSSVEPNYPFVYMNLYLNGGLTADSVRFSGDGFEFDNITTSTLAQTPQNSMVLAGGVLGKSVQFLPNASGTSGSMAVQTDTTTANLTTNSFTNPGYTFNGWNTASNNTGTPYSDGQSYNFANDMTLYAQWAPIVYPVTYDSQGGSSAAGTTYSTGGNFNLAPTPTRAGYTFNGWFTASSGGSALTSPYSPPGYGPVVLYAQWTPLPAQTLTWTPTNLAMDTSPGTPNNLASTSGDGPITYSVVDPGNSGCSVNANTGVITYYASGTCKVRATAAATANYSSAYVERIFTLSVPANNTNASSLAITGGKPFIGLIAAMGALSAGLYLLARVQIQKNRRQSSSR